MPTRSGEKTCLQTARANCEQNSAPRRTHTTNTHTHNTTHTTTPPLRTHHVRTPESPSSKHYSPYAHTGLHCKASELFDKHKCKHKNDCQMIAKQSDCSKKDNVSLWRPHHWGTNCQLKSGVKLPFSESHDDGFHTHPTSMQPQRKARNFDCRKKYFI